MSVFTWQPDFGAEVDHTPRILSARYGDGYEQRAGDGLNTDLGKWSVTFTQGSSTTQAILNFLRPLNGTDVFQWTPPEPGASQGNYVCKTWKVRPAAYNNWQISAEFQQVVN